jgi:hypothetical protein
MKIGIVGSGGHSSRIQKILHKKKLDFYIYKPGKPNYFDQKKFADLKKCKIIFIISPNNTHYAYIEKLYKGRFIFCEKPPVNNKKDLLKLKKIKSKKIYFNYNFRFMKIVEIIMKKDEYKLKNLVYANLSLSHGLAQKNEYKKNWRSNLKRCPKGIFEIVSIHYVDLINYLFNVSKIEKPKLINLSKIGNSYENGIVEQRDNIITIRGPSLNLDKKGFFKSPKIIKTIKINENKDYRNSLYDSVTFFLDCAKNKKIFNKKNFDISIKSNSLIL